MNKVFLLILLSATFAKTIIRQSCSAQQETTSPVTEFKCGDVFPNQCQNSKYRTYDGSCNNLLHPTWGMAFTRHGRLLPANYADGIHIPIVSSYGRPLPHPRTLSYYLNPALKVLDKKFTLMTMQFGQIMAEDTSFKDALPETSETQCCTVDGKLDKDYLKKPLCYPLIIPDDDPDYKKSGIKCRTFLRTNTDLYSGCSTRHGAAEQLSRSAHFLELSMFYGASDSMATSTREKKGGRLTTEKRNGLEWLPTIKEQYLFCNGTATLCYRGVEERINLAPQMTIIHIHLLREHNRIAGILNKLNSHWTDEKIFQEARSILIAMYQCISYNEWLPLILGVENCYKNKLVYETKDYVKDYDASVDPSISNEFATAAFRSFHTLIAGNLELVKENRKPANSSIRISDHFDNPSVIEEDDNYDDLSRGLCTQPQEAADKYHNKEITVFFRKGKQILGSDLRALDIQRSRDHGLATYNDYRSFCNILKASDWNDFLDLIPPEDVKKLSELYETPDDVDLSVAAMLERNIPGTLAGPTFTCILTRQFLKTRRGDRYWFENGNNGFTLEQLNEIRKASISKLICDNGNNIQSMQLKGFEQVSEKNPLVRCKDIPSINLSLWKESGSRKETNKHVKID